MSECSSAGLLLLLAVCCPAKLPHRHSLHACSLSTGPKALGQPLKGIDHDCNDIPDAAMTLAVAALFAQVRAFTGRLLCCRVHPAHNTLQHAQRTQHTQHNEASGQQAC